MRTCLREPIGSFPAVQVKPVLRLALRAPEFALGWNRLGPPFFNLNSLCSGMFAKSTMATVALTLSTRKTNYGTFLFPRIEFGKMSIHSLLTAPKG
jgi:hypothetical protein